MNKNPDRSRALRATRVVTFASTAALGCGTTSTTVEPPGPLSTVDGHEEHQTLVVRPAEREPAEAEPESEARIILGPDSVLSPAGPAASAAEQAETLAAAECSKVPDKTCPPTCTTETDADCCERGSDANTWLGCAFSVEWGCNCAIEGPFAPPRFVCRTAARS
jgi:hypothetical protein